MACTSALIPAYLHWNGRQTYTPADFLDEHRIYRIGNPIEFPNGTITAWSCKWSFIIQEEDVLKADDPPAGDSYKYGLVSDIKECLVKRQKVDGGNIGWHKLSCYLTHVPKECDYSHCEILIRHLIFEDEDEGNIVNDYLYTYEMWEKNEALLQSKNSFYKNLRKDYRVEVIKAFLYPIQNEQAN